MKIDEQTIAYSKNGIHLEIGRKAGAIENPHTHDDEYQLEVILEGMSENLADTRHQKVLPGYIDIYNPGEKHQTNYLNTDSFIFHIKLSALNKIYHDMNLYQQEPIFKPTLNKKCNIPVTMLQQELQFLKNLQTLPRSETTAAYQEDKALTLLKLFLRDLEDTTFNQRLRTVDYYSRQRMLKIKEWLHANFHQDDISIDKLADMGHLSRFHFIRIFKQVLGKSPYDYLMEIRVNAAISILKNGKYKSIDDVSLAVGFRNTSQLRYHIKKIKGYLPSQVL